MHVVTHAGAVGRRVVGAVDARRAALGDRVEHEREEVVRARVVQVGGRGADDVEVPQRRVTQAGGDGLVAQQPLADQLGLAVRRLGGGRRLLGHEARVGRAVDRGARREDHRVDALRAHGLEQVRGARDVLLVRVQRSLDRDARVLEAREVHDADDAVADDRVRDEVGVEDRPAHEGHVLGDELGVPAREIVEDDASQPDSAERLHDVRSDVSRPAGDQPCHAANHTDPDGVVRDIWWRTRNCSVC